MSTILENTHCYHFLFIFQIYLTDQNQFYRAWSSDSAVLEDDVNVFYKGLVKRIESGDIQLIDVREASELAEFGQIPNSTHIPCKSTLTVSQVPIYPSG